ncbi:transcription termination/antitermination NusG family protein [Ensifer aridi]|uniref:transcription termination/antitermination NusG family protein n=1 Tax=Ensifer aridi TaxID=1708715 RepID=UPI0003F6FB50|nr:transcription termination/antitermination NusG family protein [Ensifer aridi]
MQRRIYQGVPVIIDDPRIDPARMAKAWAKDGLRSIRANMLSMAAANQPGQKSWFVLQTLTGREKAVENVLEQAGVEALVPTRKAPDVRRRGRIIEGQERPIMRGYVMVHAVLSPASLAGLRRVEHVIGIVGGAERPWCADDKSVKMIKALAGKAKAANKAQALPFEPGEKVAFKEGPFYLLEGVVVAVDGERLEAEIEVMILGGHVPFKNVPLEILEKV